MSTPIEQRSGQENLASIKTLPSEPRRPLIERAFDRVASLASSFHRDQRGGIRPGHALLATAGAGVLLLANAAVPEAISAGRQALNNLRNPNPGNSGKFEDPSRGNTENAVSAQQTGGIALRAGYKMESRVHIPITRPGESNQTPATPTPPSEGTPTPTVTPTPPTESPTATPDIRPSYPWPESALKQLDKLPVLEKDKLRFGLYREYNQIPYEDIKRLFAPPNGSIPTDGANADIPRRMIHILSSQELDNMWLLLTIGHEIAHFHQAEQSRLNGMNPDSRPDFQQSYLNTPEGKAFVAASAAAIENARTKGQDFTYPFPWQTRVFGQNPYEDGADLCSIWYNQPEWLEGEAVAPLRQFAQQHWPK